MLDPSANGKEICSYCILVYDAELPGAEAAANPAGEPPVLPSPPPAASAERGITEEMIMSTVNRLSILLNSFIFFFLSTGF
jgi:hypothetical protein